MTDEGTYVGDFRWADGETETVNIRPGESKSLRCGCAIAWHDGTVVVDGLTCPHMKFEPCDRHRPSDAIYLTSLVRLK